MFNQLVVLGWTIIVFAIVLGVGTVVLEKLGSAVSSCPTAYPTYNVTSQYCQNSSGATVSPSSATSSINYMNTNLGSSSGLASWTPAVIALAIGLLFIGAFMLNRSKKA